MENQQATTATETPETVPSGRAAELVRMRDNISSGTALAIIPRTLSELQSMAGVFAASALVPDKLRNSPANICMVVEAGLELGFPPVRSMSLFHLMWGIPRPSAEALAAIVIASPLCDYFEPVSFDGEHAKFRTRRRGRSEVVLAYTVDDARRAGIFDRKDSLWPRYPMDLCIARARSKLARLVYPDLCAGITSAEEAADGEFIDVQYKEISTAPAAFAAPQTLATPGPAAAPANDTTPAAETRTRTRGGKKDPPATIDATSTEVRPPATGNASPTPAASSAPPAASQPAPSNAGSQPSPNSFGTPQTSSSGATPPESSASSTDVQPLPSPAAQPASSAPAAGAGASDDFGDEPAPAERPRSLPLFKEQLAAVPAGPHAAEQILRLRRSWIPWAKNTDEGKQASPHLKTAFVERQTQLGISDEALKVAIDAIDAADRAAGK